MLALSLDGAGVFLFFLVFFATGANLCWRRLARPLPAKAIPFCAPEFPEIAKKLASSAYFFPIPTSPLWKSLRKHANKGFARLQ